MKYTVEVLFNSKYWYKENSNILHREDGPAVEYANGSKYWYLNGKLHREDGPAMEYANGDKCWYLNGKLHREDGPAVEISNKYKEWYFYGQNLTQEEFNNRVKKSNYGVKYKITLI